MCWFLVILFLSLTYGSVSEAHHKKDHSVVVVGTVFCDTCSQQDITPSTPFIPGAKVGVECKVGNSIPSFKKEVETDKHGDFKVKLPLKVWKHAKIIKGCTVKLISSSEPHCNVPSVSTSSSLSLIATKQGEHIFSAGLFSFKPVKKPSFCNQKQSVPNPSSPSDKKSAVDTFFPPIPLLPPIPFLPPFPNLPPFPFLPPNPFLPPLQPSNPILPPNPLLPPLTPTPVQPPSSPPHLSH